ncbi:MAG: AMP-binding protein [Pseudomonadales bacterium]|nr:AMP-binding protein [Pseudomonadales bacterium]
MSLPSSLVERLYYYAENNPKHDALVTLRTTLSYGQLARLVSEQVQLFANQGISNSSVVGIKCADDIEHLVLCMAATQIGATSCTIASHEPKQVQTSLSERCGVTHLVETSSVVPIPVAEVPECDAVTSSDQITLAPTARLLFSTSGTTGEPKLVVHQDCDLVAQAHRHVGSDAERFACLASMEHNFAKRHRLYALAAGATNIFFETTGESLVAQSLTMAVNVLHVSAFQAQELLAVPEIEKLANIRLKLGGGHVPIKLRQQLRTNITKDLQAGYGTTETGAIGFTDPEDADSGESVGQPLPGIEVQVVCPDRHPLGTGERGEIAIRCEGMFREYLDNSDGTAARLVDGWFYTGDIGYVDQQERIHLCGRSDDMFVFNSMNIYPQDIESTILEHPDIVDAAVIPKASPVHGNIPVALLVFKQGVKQRLPEIEKFVQKRVGVRSPRQYLIVPEIPKTDSGKTSRSKAIHLPNKSGEIRTDILGMLPADAIDHLKPAQIRAFKTGDQDILFKRLEMDSLDRMNFLVSVELEYDTIITPRELRRFRYLGNVVARILSPDRQDEQHPPTRQNGSEHRVTDLANIPFVTRFVQRFFRYCNTVAQLNQALTILESRITPLEVESLYDFDSNNQLLPADAAPKFQVAMTNWLQEMKDSMGRSGKASPEPYSLRRLAPNICHFFGPGSSSSKTLLICFPPRSLRQMGIPNAVFLQHADAEQFDVLVVSGPFETGYRHGRSQFKEELAEFGGWLNGNSWLQKYRQVRTLGFSAGGRTAIAAGYLLDAEIAFSVSGRFHRKRFILKNLDQVIAIWNAARSKKGPRAILSYAPRKSS